MNPNKRKHFVIRFVSAAVFIASLSGFAGSIYALVKMQSLHVNSMAPEAVREYVFNETAQEQIHSLLRMSSFDNVSDKRFSGGIKDTETSVVSPNHFFKIYNSDNTLLYSKETPSKSGFITVYTLSDYQSVDEYDDYGNFIKSQMIQKEYKVESQIVKGAHDVFWFYEILITKLLEIGYRLYGILIVSAFLMLASWVTFTKHAGIRNDEGTIEQNPFDRIPLEPFALLYLFVFGFSISLIGESVNLFYRDVPNAFLMGSSITILLLGLSFIFYNSFIKRIKAKQLLVNSWIYRWGYLPIKRLYKSSFQNRDLILKVSMIVGASLLFDFITMTSISNHNNGTMIFFWLLKTGVVVYFILKFTLDGKVIRDATHAMVFGNLDEPLDTTKFHGVLKDHAHDLNQLSDGMHLAVEKQLELVLTQDVVYANLDGNVLFRILDNLFGNICKYSLMQSRVYVSLKHIDQNAVLEIKNISDVSLNISADELMERFVRGDASRNTEGSGLGLSIAKALTEVMGGDLKLHIDGDLFKVKLSFPLK